MEIQRITPQNRNRINAFIVEHWYTTRMIVRGKEIDMTTVDGVFLADGQQIIGLVTWITYERDGERIMEITSLDSLCENQGNGIRLLEEAIRSAGVSECKRIILITTNDNINALRFYQKRGFDMVHLYHNALEVSRKLKPEIPLIGDNDIPLRHEIEFEMIL